jgi:hypothetical protein
MGWWESEGGVIGDGILDAAEEFLARISQEYTTGLGRGPTLEEVLDSLQLILDRRAGEFLDGGQHFSVGAISGKKKKRPAKRRLMPGDVFAIPLEPGRYGFGRLLRQYGMAQFYDVISDRLLKVHQLRKYGFWPARLMTLDQIEDGTWPVIGISRDGLDSIPLQQFRIGGRATAGDHVKDGFVHVTADLRAADPAELTLLPELEIAGAETIRTYLLANAGSLGGKL